MVITDSVRLTIYGAVFFLCNVIEMLQKKKRSCNTFVAQANAAKP